jgi:hypothetical protein
LVCSSAGKELKHIVLTMMNNNEKLNKCFGQVMMMMMMIMTTLMMMMMMMMMMIEHYAVDMIVLTS